MAGRVALRKFRERGFEVRLWSTRPMLGLPASQSELEEILSREPLTRFVSEASHLVLPIGYTSTDPKTLRQTRELHPIVIEVDQIAYDVGTFYVDDRSNVYFLNVPVEAVWHCPGRVHADLYIRPEPSTVSMRTFARHLDRLPENGDARRYA